MSHIGIKCFRPGHRQNDRAEQHKALPRIGHDQTDRVNRVQSLENGRVLCNLGEADEPDRAEPKNNYRAEKPADAARPVALQHKQDDQHGERQR